MHKLLITLAAFAVIAAGCSSGAAAEPTTTVPAPPETMTTLPPATTTVPPATTTSEQADTEAPTIVTDPAFGDVIDWYSGDIIIDTEPGTTVTVNGEPAEPFTDGSFVFPVKNIPGDNTIEVTVTDESGNTTEETIIYEFSPPSGWIAAIGDSVMLGTKAAIEERVWPDMVNADVSRQFLDAPKLVEKLMTREEPPQVILIGLGTNGAVQTRHFDEVMEAAGPDTEVVFVNVRVPRPWEAESNAELAAGVARYENATLVDWFSVADERDELFAADGFHPSIAGRVVLADLIAEAIYPTDDPAEG